jgi:hypothetical protein
VADISNDQGARPNLSVLWILGGSLMFWGIIALLLSKFI